MGANAQTSVPTFTASQVLTAAQMNQSARTGVPVAADNTARDGLFGGTGEKTLAEGQLVYVEGTSGGLQMYDGSAWITIGTGKWISYTPTLTNITLGNGTLSALYIRIGRFAMVKFVFTLGSTSAIAANPTFSLPLTGATTGTTSLTPYGFGYFGDTGVNNYFGMVGLDTTTTARFWGWNAAGTIIQLAEVNATAPFTWGNTDVLAGNIFYEVAS